MVKPAKFRIGKWFTSRKKTGFINKSRTIKMVSNDRNNTIYYFPDTQEIAQKSYFQGKYSWEGLRKLKIWK